MAPNRKGGLGDKSAKAIEQLSANEKIARLLGLIAIKELEDVKDQVTFLRNVGFGVSEVSSMLGITENHVRVATHHGRKKQKARKLLTKK